jgi:hypothetical protein
MESPISNGDFRNLAHYQAYLGTPRELVRLQRVSPSLCEGLQYWGIRKHPCIKRLSASSGSLEREEGRDLVENALVVARIACGAIAGIEFLAGFLRNRNNVDRKRVVPRLSIPGPVNCESSARPCVASALSSTVFA